MTPSHPIRRAWRAAVLTGALAVAVGACSAAGATPSPSAAVDAPLGDCPTSQPEPLPAGETRSVTITTDLGEIVIGLEADLSPIAVGNFAALAACDYYDGIVFHRVVPGFVIQGGDPTAAPWPWPGPPSRTPSARSSSSSSTTPRAARSSRRTRIRSSAP
jgi:hypothetical protein